MFGIWPNGYHSIRVALIVVAGCCTTLGITTTTASTTRHPISIIATDAYVGRTKVNLRLRIFAEDLYLFHDIEANEFDQIPVEEIEWGMEQHKAFLLERIIIRDAEGQALPGKLVSMEPFDIPSGGVPVGSLMEYSITYELEFALAKPPEFLTFAQEVVDPNGIFPSEVQLHIKQSGSGSTYQTVVYPDEPDTARFDWDHPPLSPDAEEEAWEEWFTRQREETLGITSYSSVYSFIYITDHEVRHEVLIPLMTLNSIFEIESEDKNFLTVEEQDRAKPLIEAFFRNGNPIRIDGIEVKPVFDRIDFYGLDFKDFAMQAERRKVSTASGRVGAIISYPAKSHPTTVDVLWNLFPSTIVAVNSVAIAYDEMEKVKFSRFKSADENTYRWSGEKRAALPAVTHIQAELPSRPRRELPLVALVALGMIGPALVLFVTGAGSRWFLLAAIPVLVVTGYATWPYARVEIDDPFASTPAISEEYKKSVFTRLHTNTYRAFDYRNESDIYDSLSASVDGEMLRDLYVRIRSGLEMQSQGGAVARVEKVDIIKGQSPASTRDDLPWPGYQFECTWTVRGTIEHWGHIHQRTNEYTALFSVQPRDDNWKITHMELVDQKRGKVNTDLRTF